MSARDEILGRVRRGIGKDDLHARRAAAYATLTTAARGPQPAMDTDLTRRFRGKAESLASTVAVVEDWPQAPGAVADYLAVQGLGRIAVACPDLAALDWAAAGLQIEARPAADGDSVGISGCFCAIAETGTLLLLSGPATPATVSLLPETHIALIPTARIVATMENAFDLLRAECDTMPRAANFVSGPSRTGDIEQTIVLGAHGPCRVHLILIGNRP